MRKRHFVCMGLILLVLVLGCPPQNSAQTTGEPLQEAMTATGAEVHEMEINGWTKLPSADLSGAAMRCAVENAMMQVGFLSNEVQVTQNTSHYHRMVRAEGKKDGLQAAAILQVIYPRQNSSLPEAYFVLNIQTAQTSEAMEHERFVMRTFFRGMGWEPHITTCLVGWLNGKLEGEQMKDRLTNAFRTLDAGMEEGVTYGDFASYTGFTSRISESLTVGAKRFNVNMAMRYSPDEDRTYVIIGSPVITREY